MNKEKTHPSKLTGRPWRTQPCGETLNKGINIRMREDEYNELKELCNKDEMSMTNTGRVLLRRHLKRLRKKYSGET